MNLKKYIECYDTGKIHFIELRDEEGYAQGEYIEFDKNGNIYFEGFLKNNTFIGKYYHIKDKMLKLSVKYDSHTVGGVSYKHVSDEKNKTYGEYIDYYTNGQIAIHCFCVDNFDVGIFKIYNFDGKIQDIRFFSLKNPGHEINEAEYKKELAQYRLGIIKCPALEIFIKDYDENGKIK